MKSHDEVVLAAQAYVDGKRTEATAEEPDPFRFAYHLMPITGWINDPNGLVYWRGQYHAFYQYHPFSAVWGPMHWGHAVSEDMVHWRHLPIALAPSEPYDKDGCFSGSAVALEDRLALVYTGRTLVDGQTEVQVQCLATSTDGIHFTKYAQNPVIGQIPPEATADFRDPKVWATETGFSLVLGTGKDGIGKALLYESPDLVDWTYQGVLAQSDGHQGYIWECPDVFTLSGHRVLLISPIGLDRRKSIFLIDGQEQDVDDGQDFYAPQTFVAADGRRVLIGWMGDFDAKIPTQARGWSGALTIPRELRIAANGDVLQRPVREIEALRNWPLHIRLVDCVLDGVNREVAFAQSATADAFECEIEWALADCTAHSFGAVFRASADRAEQIVLTVDMGKQEVVLDRSSCLGDATGMPARLTVPLSVLGDLVALQRITMRVFCDRSSIEVFMGERSVMTARVFPSSTCLGSYLFAHGGSVRAASVDMWPMLAI